MNYLDNSKHLRGVILLAAFGIFHFLFTNAHVLSHAKFGLCNRDLAALLLHSLPYR